jgi:hypothetical protein
MKVLIPGFLTPIAAAHVEVDGKRILLRPRDRWPVFEEGSNATKGIEHLLGPIVVDYPAPEKKAATPKKDTEDVSS